MKKLTLSIFMIFLINIINSTPIQEITDIRNETIVSERDVYNGAIFRYNNRLITLSTARVQEFNILLNGELERVSYIERKNDYYTYARLNEDRLYYYSDTFHTGTFHLEVMDISVPPIKKIASINTNIKYAIPSMLFTDEHIILTDWDNQRATMINKQTFEIEGYIKDLYGGHITQNDSILIIPKRGYGNDEFGYSLWFYNIVDLYKNELEEISSIFLPFGPDSNFIDIEVQGEKVVVTHINGVTVVDIDDIKKPKILCDIPIFTSSQFNSSLFIDSHVLTLNTHGELYVYELDESDNYILKLKQENKHWCNF